MKSPLVSGRRLLQLESVDSTQTHLRELVSRGDDVAIVLALEQTAGRGRLGRTWYSPKGSCLAVSMAFFDYADWPAPHLVGMAVAIAIAEALDCDVVWPNDLTITPAYQISSRNREEDVLSQHYRKLGGVLTELARARDGKLIPIVGVGLNLSVEEFPADLRSIATSLVLSGRERMEPDKALDKILERLVHIPEPDSWRKLKPLWERSDHTAGKRFRLPDGRIAVAAGVGEDGQLIADAGGELVEVPSAQGLLANEVE